MKKTLFPDSEDRLYLQLYRYYKEQIRLGSLVAGAKMPSIRACSEQFNISRTTVENAYLQLAAEGYIRSKPQSGYYVSEGDLVFPFVNGEKQNFDNFTETNIPVPNSTDSTFDFRLWQRYLKSVLRDGERLLCYGNVQGEYELREAVCDYIHRHRNAVCTPEDIVIGAGTQCLLQLLLAVTGAPQAVAMVGMQFMQGQTVFEDHGANVYLFSDIPNNLNDFLYHNIKAIYLFPSHMTKKGGVMPIAQRTRLLRFARENNILLIEDDYDSELLYDRPAPSLQGLDGGQCTVYLGTFSKLLLPSLRISFMILPASLREKYRRKADLYNQTASVSEQLALAAFIRDGRLDTQIRRSLRKTNTKYALVNEAKQDSEE